MSKKDLLTNVCRALGPKYGDAPSVGGVAPSRCRGAGILAAPNGGDAGPVFNY